MPEFPCAGPITTTVRVGGGSVDVTAEERTTALVEVSAYDDTDASRFAAANTVIEMHGDSLIIAAPDAPSAWLWRRSARLRVTARVPIDSGLVFRLASARAGCQGRYRAAEVSTASGNVSIERVTEDLHVKSASGSVTVDGVGREAQVRSASGRIRLGTVGGDAGAHTASGDVEIESLGGSLRVVTASGDIRVGELRRGAVSVKSASGDVRLGVVAGTGVWLDIASSSGAVHSDLAMAAAPPLRSGADVELHIRTASGNIELRRVAGAPAASGSVPAATRTTS